MAPNTSGGFNPRAGAQGEIGRAIGVGAGTTRGAAAAAAEGEGRGSPACCSGNHREGKSAAESG